MYAGGICLYIGGSEAKRFSLLFGGLSCLCGKKTSCGLLRLPLAIKSEKICLRVKRVFKYYLVLYLVLKFIKAFCKALVNV